MNEHVLSFSLNTFAMIANTYLFDIFCIDVILYYDFG